MEVVKLGKHKEKAIKKALAVLSKGGLVVYPTETCYGIGAEATNPLAISKLLRYKGGRQGQPISIAVADIEMARQYVVPNEIAKNLYQNFLPGPLTVVSKSKGKTDKRIESSKHTLGIRIPDYPLILKLIKRLNKPITSTSANTSGKKTPYSLEDLLKYTSQKRLSLIDLFLDAGRLPPHPPSTVVDTTLNELAVLRQGEIDFDQLQTKKVTSASEKETKEIAKKLFWQNQSFLKTGALVFALQGELGTGKTCFAKGLGKALKIKQNIISPSFVILREYNYRLNSLRGKLYHLDTWRLESEEELKKLISPLMLSPQNILAIEWPQKARTVLKEIEKQKNIKLILVEITHQGKNKRELKIYGA